MFIYFGGSRIVWQQFDKLDASTVGCATALRRKFLELFVKEITGDLDTLEDFFIGEERGRFWEASIVDGHSVWIYCHTGQVNCSSVTYTQFKTLLSRKPIVQNEHVSSCRESDHFMFEAFFSDNNFLRESFKEDLQSTEEGSQRKTFLTSQLDKITSIYNGTCSEVPFLYLTPGAPNMHGFTFDENVWTKRLYGGLRLFLPNCEVRYTAEDYKLGSGFPGEQHLTTTLDAEYSKCYLFKGFPDITISQQVVIQTGTGTEEQDLSSDEFPIEHKRSALDIKPVPDILGELLAQLHLLCVQKCLKVIFKKNSSRSSCVENRCHLRAC